jgi:hypothetical protein
MDEGGTAVVDNFNWVTRTRFMYVGKTKLIKQIARTGIGREAAVKGLSCQQPVRASLK